MTISSTTRKAGPFTGNGATVAFPFTFKVFAAADLSVVQAVTATGVETTKALTADYTVALNADQNATPGGTLTMLVAPPTGTALTFTSAIANLQSTDLTNAGGFYPKVINDALDRATIQIQQLAEKVARSLQFSLGNTGSPALPVSGSRANNLLGFDSAGNPAMVAPVSGSSSDLALSLVSSSDSAKGSGQVRHGGNLNYVAGTIGAVLNDACRNVKMFPWLATGDGVTDDTAAIQAAITYAGAKNIYLPPGTYNISAPLNFTATGITFYGANQYGTVIRQLTNGVRIINNTGAFNEFYGFATIYTAATPTLGAIAFYSSGSNSRISRVIVRNCFDGFSYTGGSAHMADNFQIFDYESTGITCSQVNDVFVSKFILNAGNTTKGVLGGIRLTNQVEAFICTDGDILQGKYSMTTDASVFTLGARPAYNNFTNVYFDSSDFGTLLTKLVETEFVGCWFSAGRAGAGTAGCTVQQTDSVKFTNTRFFNCGGQGCSVESLARRTTFVNCSVNSNSVTAGPGVAHGIQFTNTTDFEIIGGVFTNGLYTGTQGYGIFIGSGCDYFVIRDANVRGNATGGILDASSSTADKLITAIGYRTTSSGTATILSGATSVVVNHGLSITPAQSDIILTRGSGNSGSIDMSANNITATQFQINTLPAPSVNIIMNWHVRSKGA